LITYRLKEEKRQGLFLNYPFLLPRQITEKAITSEIISFRGKMRELTYHLEVLAKLS